MNSKYSVFGNLLALNLEILELSLDKLTHETKLEMLSLFDEDGNKTYVMKKLEELYHKGKYGPFDLLMNKTNAPLGLSSKMVWELVHGKKKKVILYLNLDYKRS